MNNRLSRTAVLFFLVMCLAGCTHVLVPPVVPLEAKQLPIIKSDKAISVKILQTPTPEQFVLLQTGVHKHVVSAEQMNQVARTALQDMLSRNGLPLRDDAKKTIEIAVVSADGHSMRYVYNARVRIKTQLGGKISREFSGQDFSTRIAQSLSEATNNALVDMLKDPEVQQYLAQ
jgi:hypothetical protein